MPGPADLFGASSTDLKITGWADHTGPARVRLHLVGEVDLDSAELLNDAVGWLTGLSPVAVQVDLAAVTYAGAALPNFVSRVSGGLPRGAELTLHGATPMTRWVLWITDMDEIATITDDGLRNSDDDDVLPSYEHL